MKSAHFHLSVFGHLSRRGKVKYTESESRDQGSDFGWPICTLMMMISRNIEGDDV